MFAIERNTRARKGRSEMDFLEDFELHTLTFVDKSWPSTSHIGNILDLGGKRLFYYFK